MTPPDPWAAEAAAFDPDGLYLALAAMLAGGDLAAQGAFLPYPAAAEWLRPSAPGPEASVPLAGPISLAEAAADGLLLYAGADLPVAGLSVAIGSGPVAPAVLVRSEGEEGARRFVVRPEAYTPPQPDQEVVVRAGDALLFRGPAGVAGVLPPGARLQFRRFSADGLWLGCDGAARIGSGEGPLPVAIQGDGFTLWRWAGFGADKEGRPAWRIPLDGLVRPGRVQGWRLALPAGGEIGRGRFLTFADDGDRLWMRPPERHGEAVGITLVRDRVRQDDALALRLVLADGAALEGEPAADPPGFAFRSRHNSWRFPVPRGGHPDHLGVYRRGRELFRLSVGGDAAA